MLTWTDIDCSPHQLLVAPPSPTPGAHPNGGSSAPLITKMLMGNLGQWLSYKGVLYIRQPSPPATTFEWFQERLFYTGLTVVPSQLAPLVVCSAYSKKLKLYVKIIQKKILHMQLFAGVHKIGSLKIFAKFTGKHLYQSLCLIS